MNGTRRIAFVSAVNYRADAPFVHERKGKDRWFHDDRIDRKYQAGNEFYAGNDLDRGHLARRADAAWGDTEEEARLANDDTFHFTNCSPQDEVFNQGRLARQRGLSLWGNLEDHIAAQAREGNPRLCIFNGPVFGANDRTHRGLKIPAEYWKVVVFEKARGKPSAVAFLLSQADLLANLPEEAFEPGEFHVYQVPVRRIEARTGLKFGALRDYDPVDDEENEVAFEADAEVLPLRSLDQVIL